MLLFSYRYDYDHHTRQDKEIHVNSDLKHRALVSGDLEIGTIMAENNIPMRKRKKQQQLKILPTLARPLIKNPEKFSSPIFPFTAIVGQEEMKLALQLNVIDPKIGMEPFSSSKNVVFRAVCT